MSTLAPAPRGIDKRRDTDVLLDVRHLVVDFITPRGPCRAVDDVSFAIRRGEVFGLAGESGCGKSTVAHAVMRLIKSPGQISGGQVLFEGRDILPLSPGKLQQFRWRHASIVFQSAMTALNPVINLGEQISDAIMAHETMSKRQALERAAELFKLVGIESRRLKSFPHELSGGMRQRAVIAMAMALNPELVIMDEPTTALDVVVQRDILRQVEALKRDFGFAVLFITHDLSLLLEFADRIGIMYAGELVETAPARTLLDRARHPYTLGLLRSFPPLTGPIERMTGIPGSPPDLANPPSGCRFHPRCPLMQPTPCISEEPALRVVGPSGRRAACHFAGGDA